MLKNEVCATKPCIEVPFVWYIWSWKDTGKRWRSSKKLMPKKYTELAAVIWMHAWVYFIQTEHRLQWIKQEQEQVQENVYATKSCIQVPFVWYIGWWKNTGEHWCSSKKLMPKKYTKLAAVTCMHAWYTLYRLNTISSGWSSGWSTFSKMLLTFCSCYRNLAATLACRVLLQQYPTGTSLMGAM